LNHEKTNRQRITFSSTNPLNSLWATILSNLKLQMTQTTFDTWLLGTQCIDQTDHTLQVAAKSAQAVDWLAARLGGVIDRTVLRVTKGKFDAVQFTVEEKAENARCEPE
jgi:chromosomal replication initiation ATPase DnaA